MMAEPSHSSTPPVVISEKHNSSSGNQSHSEEIISSSPSSSSSSGLPWIKWSRSLDALLNDPQGQDLFEYYLKQEKCHEQLYFLWACNGIEDLARDDPSKLPDIIRKIFRTYIKNNVPHGIQEETRNELIRAVTEAKDFSVKVFDKAREEVRTHMGDHLYPNFLRSDVYLSAANEDLEAKSNLERLGRLRLDSCSSSVRNLHKHSDDSTSHIQETLFEDHESYVEACSKSEQCAAEKLAKPELKESVDPLTGVPLTNITSIKESYPSSNAQTVNTAFQDLQTVYEDSELAINQASLPSGQNGKFKLTKQALLATQSARAAMPVPGSTLTKIRRGDLSSPTSSFSVNHAMVPGSVPFPYHASYASYNPVSRVDSEINSLSSDGQSKKHSHRHHHKLHDSHSGSSGHHHGHESRRHNMSDSRYRHENKDNLHSIKGAGIGRSQSSGNREAELEPAKFADKVIKKLQEHAKELEKNENLSRKIEYIEKGGTAHFLDKVPQASGNQIAVAIKKLQKQEEGRAEDILENHVHRIWPQTPDKSPHFHSPKISQRKETLVHSSRKERDVVSTFSADSGNVHDFPYDSHILSGMPKSSSVPHELKSVRAAGDVGAFGRGGHFRSRGAPLATQDFRRAGFGIKASSSDFIDSGISCISGATPTTPLPSHSASDRVNQWVEQCLEEKPSKKSMKKSLSSGPAFLEETRRKLVKSSAKQGLLFTGSSGGRSSINAASSYTNSAGAGYSSNSLPRNSSQYSGDDMSRKEATYTSCFVSYEDDKVPYWLKVQSKTGSGVTLALFKDNLPKKGNYRFFFQRECLELDAKVVQEEVIDDSQVLPLHDGKIIAHIRAAASSSSSSQVL